MLGLIEMALADRPPCAEVENFVRIAWPKTRGKFAGALISSCPTLATCRPAFIALRFMPCIIGELQPFFGLATIPSELSIVTGISSATAKSLPLPAHNPASRNGIDNNACFVLEAIEKTGQVVERYRDIVRHPAGIVSRTVIDV